MDGFQEDEEHAAHSRCVMNFGHLVRVEPENIEKLKLLKSRGHYFNHLMLLQRGHLWGLVENGCGDVGAWAAPSWLLPFPTAPPSRLLPLPPSSAGGLRLDDSPIPRPAPQYLQSCSIPEHSLFVSPSSFGGGGWESV